MASVKVKGKQATHALLLNLEKFKYDMRTNKDSLTKGEGIEKYKTRLENLIEELKNGEPATILNKEQKYLAYVKGLKSCGMFKDIIAACETNNKDLKGLHENIKRIENPDGKVMDAIHGHTRKPSASTGGIAVLSAQSEADIHETILNL